MQKTVTEFKRKLLNWTFKKHCVGLYSDVKKITTAERKKPCANTVYKLWLVLAHLENPADFPRASTCLDCSVLNSRHSSYT